METIFTVANDDLDRLRPDEAVDVFSELLWAEATRLGIGKNLINVPSAITVADGGIDAEVRDVEVVGGQGIIKPGLTRYQIKTGSFSVSPHSIRDILFRAGTQDLRPRVKSCLDQDGTLVVVLFGCDNPDPEDNQSRNTFLNELQGIDPKYRRAKVEIWRQNNLIGLLKSFPSLALRVNGRAGAMFQAHRSWSWHDDMRSEFKAGEAQRVFIGDLQTALRDNTDAIHMRIWGEPGIGKTRLVLEATRADDLRPQVVYCGSGSRFQDGELMNEILREDNQFSVVLVIDECDAERRSYIWNKLKHRGPRIKMVSIYSERDETTGAIMLLEAPRLDDGHVSAVIQEYGIPKDQADRFAGFCSGSPRVAHVLGQNLANNPEDLLRPPDTVRVWERYISGVEDAQSTRVEQRRIVLEHIALFKRFGYGRAVREEGQAVARLVEDVDPQVTAGRFGEIVKELRDRRILQGENTLYITPKAFHIWLWTQWWERHGDTFDFATFRADLPRTLLDWFHEMFRYASESPIASKTVRRLLGPDGPFQNGALLETNEGSRFFFALTEADPEAALRLLERTIGTRTREDLLKFETGRRQAVWALERIAVWRPLFPEAARLLLALGEAENERWSNNASGVFAGLFAVGPGPVANTEASAEERFVILREALESSSRERRILGLRACDQALESQQFVRLAGVEEQGLRRPANLWKPTTYDELFDAYRRVWQLLSERMDTLPEDEQRQAVEIILRRGHGLAMIANLADMVVETIGGLAQKPFADRKQILAKLIRFLHYRCEELPEGERRRWEQLRDSLIGDSFSSRMTRYVGMNLWEDQFDDQDTDRPQAHEEIRRLAERCAENSSLLWPELGWLVTDEAHNGYAFGYELGKADMGFTLLPAILEAQRSAGGTGSAYFLGGYFRALFEMRPEEWETQLDILVRDALYVWAPELTWRSGMTDRAALRILALAETGAIPAGQLGVFRYGRAVTQMSEAIFTKWLELLTSISDSTAASAALELYDSYYLHQAAGDKRRLPKELTLALLQNPALFNKQGVWKSMDDYHWGAIARPFVELYPDRSLGIAETMLEHFREEGTILQGLGFASEAEDVLGRIAEQHPEEVWGRITEYIGPPIDSRAFWITRWLRDGNLSIMPPQEIWRWVDQDTDNRAWYVASFVPNVLSREPDRICLAREVLVRYGTREDVRRNLMANFSSESWWGPASSHFEEKKRSLLHFGASEQDESVKRWIDEYVVSLDREIERARIEEEREEF